MLCTLISQRLLTGLIMVSFWLNCRLCFSGQIFSWIKNYLSDRYQSVQIDCKYSDAILSTSGIPQASNLGPFLFLLFVNYITTVFVSSLFLSFADDLNFFKFSCYEYFLDDIEITPSQQTNIQDVSCVYPMDV